MVVERAPEADKDAIEALSEASTQSCRPRMNVHVERRRDRPQEAASGAINLGISRKNAIKAIRREWCRSTVAKKRSKGPKNR